MELFCALFFILLYSEMGRILDRIRFSYILDRIRLFNDNKTDKEK